MSTSHLVDVDAESALVGAVLLSGGACLDECPELQPEDFGKLGLVWMAVLSLRGQLAPVDLATLTSELRRMQRLDAIGGAATLSTWADSVPSAVNASAYAVRIRDRATLRRLASTSAAMATKAARYIGPVSEIVDEAEANILALSRDVATRAAVHVKTGVDECFDALGRAASSGQRLTGVRSGIGGLDKLTAGFQPTDLIILAGRPSMGKTALAMTIARHAARACTVFFASLEMSRAALVHRLLAMDSGIESAKIRAGEVSGPDFDALAAAGESLATLALWIDDAPAQSVLDVRSQARRVARSQQVTERPLGLVVVDYLQLLRGIGGRMRSREQEVAEMSRGLKALAKELNVPVLALSQLSRACESRPDKRPMLSDLRDSGQIEQDADVVAFVYRAEVYEKDNLDARGRGEILVSKQRSGPIGTVHVAWDGPRTRFANLACDEPPGWATL